MKFLIDLTLTVVHAQESTRVGKMVLIENWDVVMFPGLTHYITCNINT